MKRYIKSDSAADVIRQNQTRPEGGYLYIFKHGIGPGTLPRDVEVIRTKDLPNSYTAVWTDRWLTTSELKEYDIPSETEINRYLDRIGYCQKNGDVVPCDEVSEWDDVICSTVMASTNGSTGDFTVIQEIYGDGYVYMTEDNVEPVYTQEYDVNLDEVLTKYPEVEKYALKGWTDETFKAGDIITKTHFAKYVEFTVGDEQMYADYKKYVAQHPEFPDPVRQIEVRINNPKCLPSAEEERRKQSEELGKRLGKMLGLGQYDIHSSTEPKYMANMVSCSSDSELDDDFLVEGYYDNQFRGLAESAETSDVSALNEYINDYANRGYFIKVHNLTDGVITEFSPDNWFDDLAKDGGATLFMTW